MYFYFSNHKYADLLRLLPPRRRAPPLRVRRPRGRVPRQAPWRDLHHRARSPPRRVHGSPSDAAFLGIVPGGAAPSARPTPRRPSTLTSAPRRQGASPRPLSRHRRQHRRNEVRSSASSPPSSSSAPEETRRGPRVPALPLRQVPSSLSCPSPATSTHQVCAPLLFPCCCGEHPYPNGLT